METEALTGTGRPFVHVAALDDTALATACDELVNTSTGAAVRFVRGHKSRSQRRFFDELAAALQFPYYFGENWHAVDDCITDLEWLPASSYLLVISHADELMSDDGEPELQAVFTTLGRAADDWQRRSPPVPFHVLFQAADAGTLAAAIQKAGVEAALHQA